MKDSQEVYLGSGLFKIFPKSWWKTMNFEREKSVNSISNVGLGESVIPVLNTVLRSNKAPMSARPLRITVKTRAALRVLLPAPSLFYVRPPLT